MKIVTSIQLHLTELNWPSIQETFYLLSLPKMCNSIKEGLNTSLDQCHENIDW